MKNITLFLLIMAGIARADQTVTNLPAVPGTPYAYTNIAGIINNNNGVIVGRLNGEDASISNLTVTVSNLNAVVTSNAAALPTATNLFAYGTIIAPSPTVVLSTLWTNTYQGRIILTVDGTLNMATLGTVTVTLTNITTTESHVISGSTLSIAGATYFSYPYFMSTNDIIQVFSTVTGTATASLTQTTVKIQ